MLEHIHPIFSSLQWQSLKYHQAQLAPLKMETLFSQDPQRFQKMSLTIGPILFDFSKNRMNEETLPLLVELAQHAQLTHKIEALFAGEKVNYTEKRPALHTALRSHQDCILYNHYNVMPDIQKMLNKMKSFTEKVRSGDWKGYTGKLITDIVNIGIGGSDLGPQMVCEALAPQDIGRFSMHFISNIDGDKISRLLNIICPETTLFIITSKTFSTLETLINARTARDWFLQRSQTETCIKQHFVAVSANKEAAISFGIDSENIFSFWDWVGGRYSLWSAVGLPIMFHVGHAAFKAMLDGAQIIDTHFHTAPFAQNIPVVLALISLWYINFWGCTTQLIAPYSQRLSRFPAYLQQLEMESNGKQIDYNAQEVPLQTSPVIWGELGNNGQHAYYQFLHQGTQLTPVDFIGFLDCRSNLSAHKMANLANMLAQAEALMAGSNDPVSYRRLSGNRPSNIWLIEELTPESLGMLIAIYEHKVFVQGVIWQINSFDQWGVELGKQLAQTIESELLTGQCLRSHDASTAALIQYIQKRCAV